MFMIRAWCAARKIAEGRVGPVSEDLARVRRWEPSSPSNSQMSRMPSWSRVKYSCFSRSAAQAIVPVARLVAPFSGVRRR